jgi:hypothetical protein
LFGSSSVRLISNALRGRRVLDQLRRPLLTWRLRLAERAIDWPWTLKAFKRIDCLLLALETMDG